MELISADNKIFIYKLTTDNGGAPCVYNGLLSLAICKPKIRSIADENNWIVGFGGKLTLGERLIYIALITKKLANGKYYKESEYFNRPDCIYRWDEPRKKYYWKKSKYYHKDGLWLEHDLGSMSSSYDKANTILSEHFVYLGKNGDDLYKSKYPQIKILIEKLKRNHRVNYSLPLREEIIELIKEYMEYNSSSIPSENDFSKLCNNEDDCYCFC